MRRLKSLSDYVEDKDATARGAASQHVEERRRYIQRKSAGSSAAASGATSQHLEEGHRDRQRQAPTHSAGSRGVGRHVLNAVNKKQEAHEVDYLSEDWSETDEQAGALHRRPIRVCGKCRKEIPYQTAESPAKFCRYCGEGLALPSFPKAIPPQRDIVSQHDAASSSPVDSSEASEAEPSRKKRRRYAASGSQRDAAACGAASGRRKKRRRYTASGNQPDAAACGAASGRRRAYEDERSGAATGSGRITAAAGGTSGDPLRYVAHRSVSNALEYIDFYDRPRLLSLLGMTDSMQEAGHLQGIEVGELMFKCGRMAEAAQGGKCRPPAEAAAYALLQVHVDNRIAFRDGPISSSVAVAHIFEFARQDTSNWRAEKLVGSPPLPLRLSPLARQRAEIEAILKYHDGEARIWQIGPELWEPLSESTIVEWGEVGMGCDFPGTRLQTTAAARGAAYLKREIENCSRRRSVEDFGSSYTLSTRSCGRPDFNNAVSTLVVRGFSSSQVGASLYWLRRVRVISLAEVFWNYQHDETFDTIYAAWLEGAVVFRKRAMRGTAGGSRKRSQA
jgi:hypothetical protein